MKGSPYDRDPRALFLNGDTLDRFYTPGSPFQNNTQFDIRPDTDHSFTAPDIRANLLMPGTSQRVAQASSGNMLMPTQAQGAPNADAQQRQEAMQMRQAMQQLLSMRPSPQSQSQLQAIMQTMQANPYMQTDDFLMGMDMLSKRHGVPSPFRD